MKFGKGGPDASKFSINSSTGELSFISPDYENPNDFNTNNVYKVVIQATDKSGNKSIQGVNVVVLNAEEDSINPKIIGYGGFTTQGEQKTVEIFVSGANFLVLSINFT